MNTKIPKWADIWTGGAIVAGMAVKVNGFSELWLIEYIDQDHVIARYIDNESTFHSFRNDFEFLPYEEPIK